MNRLKLIVPSIEQLTYRKKILADPATMDYNIGLELGVEGYDIETGCLDFQESKWSDWYERWINKEPDRYYAYLVERVKSRPIGEVAIRFDERRAIHIISIIIEGKHRGKGYGKEGLELLLDKAFYEFELEKIADEFPENRVAANYLFKNFGFRVTERNDNNILIELNRNQYLESKNR